MGLMLVTLGSTEYRGSVSAGSPGMYTSEYDIASSEKRAGRGNLLLIFTPLPFQEGLAFQRVSSDGRGPEPPQKRRAQVL